MPAEEKAKGKLKNYKLKHSRLLTCYSALLYLLAVYVNEGAVSPSEALAMIAITPTKRLEWLLTQRHLAEAHSAIQTLLDQYEIFLETTNFAEKELLEKFSDSSRARTYMSDASKFGDLVFEVLRSIGADNPFHRLLVV